MHQLTKRFLFLFIVMSSCVSGFSQQVNDSLVAKIARRFEKTQYLTLQRIIKPAVLKAQQIPEERMPCYSGMQVTIVAVFAFKPTAAYGRMLVTKRFPAVKYDEHFFQKAGYDKNFNVYYSLLSVYFPEEATFKNCTTVLQVYDQQKPSNKVWLAILTK